MLIFNVSSLSSILTSSNVVRHDTKMSPSAACSTMPLELGVYPPAGAWRIGPHQSFTHIIYIVA